LLEIQTPTSGLGADPGEAIVRFLGEWALRFLLLSFSVSPLRRLLHSNALARCRRMVGLFAFTYVSLHLLSYTFFYIEFEWAALVEDLSERAYIMVGFAAFLALAAMAATSTRGWQRRLRRNWQRLHRLIYLAIPLALVHLWWLTKDGFGELVVYIVWFACLLGARYMQSRPRNIGAQAE
jgi:sulfoxide reductase heme-binding subunit YedZ